VFAGRNGWDRGRWAEGGSHYHWVGRPAGARAAAAAAA